MAKKTQVYTTVDEETAQKLDELRWIQRQRSMSALLQEALNEYLEKRANLLSDAANTGS